MYELEQGCLTELNEKYGEPFGEFFNSSMASTCLGLRSLSSPRMDGNSEGPRIPS